VIATGGGVRGGDDDNPGERADADDPGETLVAGAYTRSHFSST